MRAASCGIAAPFGALFPTAGQVAHALLTRPPCALPRIRLACVKHAASVHSEPGSNSRVENPGRPGQAQRPARNANKKLFASELLSLAAPRHGMAAGKLKGSHHPISGSQGRLARKAAGALAPARPGKKGRGAPAPSGADNQTTKPKKKCKGKIQKRRKN